MNVCAKMIWGLGLLAFAALPASSQNVTGTLGSPGATTTIPGTQLPAPDPKFGGVIKNNAQQSKPWWAPRIVPPKGAPNVLLVITDDAGFGVPSTFGGVVPTPTMDRIATEGLRYNRVFSTALCSPTRASGSSSWAERWQTRRSERRDQNLATKLAPSSSAVS